MPSPATAAGPIANGRYTASIPVAGILSRLASDTSLTAEEKQIVSGSVLGLAGATTLNIEIRIDDATFTLLYSTDLGGPGGIATPWPMYVLDPATIVLDIEAAGDNIQAYFVRRTGNTFTLEPRSAAPTAVETFVRSVLYQSVPFEPKKLTATPSATAT